MRSKLITVVTAVASVLLVGHVAAADPVQEQFRLMEQRMAEMEDRLQATSDELRNAKATVETQQSLLSDAGLTEVKETGFRAGVGNFLQEVDVTGVVAASYNHRFLGPDDDVSSGGNVGYFRHPDSNTFALDQVWFVIDKPATEESRGGMHVEVYAGKTAVAQNTNSDAVGTPSSPNEFGLELYTGYASYLAPVGNGVQIDAGLLSTPLGAEVIQTNQNFNVTTGLLFGLQPVTHVGVQAATQLTDQIGFTAGVVNDVYNENNFDFSDGKAGYAQVSFAGDSFGMNIGAIVGTDSSLPCDNGGGAFDADSQCLTSVFDVVISSDPTETLSLWANFDWVRHFGSEQTDGDAFGVSGAGRIAITDATGFATRAEYIRAEPSFNTVAGTANGALSEIVSLTGTLDHELVEGLKVRLEARWDKVLDNSSAAFVNGQGGAQNTANRTSTSRRDQVVALAEMFYEF